MKMTESSPKGKKTLWKKEKFFISSNFFFSQTESTCRQQNKCDWKIKIYFVKGWKHYEKRRNAAYQHFLLFQSCFLKASFSTLERPYELAPGQRDWPCQFYVPAEYGCAHKITQSKHKIIIFLTCYFFNHNFFNMLLNRYAVAGCRTECLGCPCTLIFSSFGG